MSRKLYRSHRVFGYEVGRAAGPDGDDLVILETAPHQLAVSSARLLLPVSEQEAAFEATVRLAEAIDRARFLGLDMDQIRAALLSALEGQ